MKHVSAEMIVAGQAALQKSAAPRMLVHGGSAYIGVHPFKLSAALTAVFRAMSAAGLGRDKTAAERQRRHRDKLKREAGRT